MIGTPRIGWVLRYSYLWADDFDAGMEEGSKDRPCVLITSVKDDGGIIFVRVVPITHTPPGDHETAVEIPAMTKRRLGLDDAQSWILCEEGNRFAWPGPDLRPVTEREPSTIWYGPLPPGLLTDVQATIIRLGRARRQRDVARTE